MRQRRSSGTYEGDNTPEVNVFQMEQVIRSRLKECPYSFMFDRVQWQLDGTTLTLRGVVQSFYLKQVLQELLRSVKDVRQIVNYVDVASPRGLSSVREPRVTSLAG